MRALALVVAALIVSFLSLGNEISLTTAFSSVNSFRLRRREYLTSQGKFVAFQKKAPQKPQINCHSVWRKFFAVLGVRVFAPPAEPQAPERLFLGAWQSIDPPPVPPPIA